jgi:hypothetical protein
MRFIHVVILLLFSLTGFSQLASEHFIPPLYASPHSWLRPNEQVVYLSTPSITPVNYTISDGGGNILATGVVSNATPATYMLGIIVNLDV